MIELLNIAITTLDQPNIMVNKFITPNKTSNMTKLAKFLLHYVVQNISIIPMLFNKVPNSFCWGPSKMGILPQNLQLGSFMIIVTRFESLEIQLDLKTGCNTKIENISTANWQCLTI